MLRSLDAYAFDFQREPMCSVLGEGESLKECIDNARDNVLSGLAEQGEVVHPDVILFLPSPVFQDK